MIEKNYFTFFLRHNTISISLKKNITKYLSSRTEGNDRFLPVAPKATTDFYPVAPKATTDFFSGRANGSDKIFEIKIFKK